jgi:perosamine synthetase
MVVTDDPRIAELCRSMRNQGRDSTSQWLNHVRLGYNYRLSDIHAALGLAQLERIEEILQGRAHVASMYSERLAGHDLLRLPGQADEGKRSWFVYVIQFRGNAPSELRKQVRAHLQSQGIASQVYFPAIHRQPYYQEYCGTCCPNLPVTDRAAESCLALPFSTQLSFQDVQFVCDELLRALDAKLDHHPSRHEHASIADIGVSATT